MRIQNRITSKSVHSWRSVRSSGIPYAAGIVVEDCACFIGFDLWGLFFLPTERVRKDITAEHYRPIPQGYTAWIFAEGESLTSGDFRTGFHADAPFPIVQSRPWWNAFVYISYYYTEIHPNPAQLRPMLIQRGDRAWVQILGAVVPIRNDEEAGEVTLDGVLSWRSFYPGFPSSHKALVKCWYD